MALNNGPFSQWCGGIYKYSFNSLYKYLLLKYIYLNVYAYYPFYIHVHIY